MGFDLGSNDTARDPLQARVEAERQRTLAPITVLRRSLGVTPSVVVTVREALLSHVSDWRLALVGGAILAGTLLPDSAARLNRHPVAGSTVVRARMPLPKGLNDGYHKLTIATAHKEAAATLVGTLLAAFLPDWVARASVRGHCAHVRHGC